jgi:hypothetical protein
VDTASSRNSLVWSSDGSPPSCFPRHLSLPTPINHIAIEAFIDPRDIPLAGPFLDDRPGSCRLVT